VTNRGGSVFARVKESRHGEYLQIVENYRDDERVRQRLVLYVGHYDSIDAALRQMPRELRAWRSYRTRRGDERLIPQIEATDERLQALRALVKEHPELIERDRERAERHAQRQREAIARWLEARRNRKV
jgi:hypothetical protein